MVFRHDATNYNNAICPNPILFQTDDAVLLSNPHQDPESVNLFSILDQLDYLRNYEDKFTFRIVYPRTSTRDELIWEQSSNPAIEAQVTDFMKVSVVPEYE